MKQKKGTPLTTVISLGGSLICPDKIDTKFLKTFVSLIKHQAKFKRIIIITGGGKICRQYYRAYEEVTKTKKTTEFKDRIGIAMTRVNGQLVQSLFISAKIPTLKNLLPNPSSKINWGKNKVAVGCGYKSGHSTDDDAVLAAIANKSTTVINLTNIDYVYTKDPKRYKNAKPLKELTWQQYKKVLGITKWEAGSHTPFDPLASKLAQKKNLNVIIVNGQKLKSLKSIFSSKPIGTLISPNKPSSK